VLVSWAVLMTVDSCILSRKPAAAQTFLGWQECPGAYLQVQRG